MTKRQMERKILMSLLLVSMWLMAAPCSAQADYKMAGPYEVVARDGQYRKTKGGSERDMRAALTCAQTGLVDKARQIIDAYATTLQRFDGHDAPLCLIQAYDLVRAMTLAQPVDENQRAVWSAMIRRAIVPTMDAFEAASPYANGNWGAVVNRCRMACGIFLNDSALYQAAIDYHLHAHDNGSLAGYISETGQCQETGRDQGHAQLGLGMLCDICEMAWQQGDDLWGALDNRLMRGIEYSARYNLGNDVPFEQWSDYTGLYCNWSEPGSMGRGRFWDIYAKPYRHYVEKKGLSMPYSKNVLAVQAKARKQGTAKVGQETTITQAPGVKEGVKLHQVFTYPAPTGAPLRQDYDVFVQPRGSKEWTKIDTYMARVNAPQPDGSHKVSEISYAVFDFTGDVFVRVVRKGKAFRSARVRPNYRGVIANVQNDTTMQFILFQPENVSVEFADVANASDEDFDITNNLLIFTSKPGISEAEARKQAKREGRKFVSYAASYYNDQDTIRVASNTTIYLAPGSYFNSTFAIDDAENVSILGRGIARPSRGYEGCHVYRSKNVLVEGMVVCTCPIGGSDGVTLRNVCSISHPSWGDGLNVFASSNVLYDRIFCRNSDDCTTAYATRKGFTGSAHNITMRNATLWADVAHPIFIGIHGNPAVKDSITDLRYENIDILCQAEAQVDYQGCLAINCGDDNMVKRVVFDNVRIENIREGSLVHLTVSWNQKYCTAPGRGISDIVFRNISYKGDRPNLSVISGYNEERTVSNITFERLRINGRHIYDDMPGKLKWYKTADYANFLIGEHVKDIVFK